MCRVDSATSFFSFFFFFFLDRFISSLRGAWLVSIIIMFYGSSSMYAKMTVPYQTPHSMASDLSLHCLQMSLFIGR